jgi:hypothetical protein
VIEIEKKKECSYSILYHQTYQNAIVQLPMILTVGNKMIIHHGEYIVHYWQDLMLTSTKHQPIKKVNIKHNRMQFALHLFEKNKT